jgi:hypothetical protein
MMLPGSHFGEGAKHRTSLPQLFQGSRGNTRLRADKVYDQEHYRPQAAFTDSMGGIRLAKAWESLGRLEHSPIPMSPICKEPVNAIATGGLV